MSFLGRGKGLPTILICFGETEKVVLFEHSDQIQCNVIASCETEKLSAAAATIHLCSLQCRRFGTIRAKLKHASWKRGPSVLLFYVSISVWFENI